MTNGMFCSTNVYIHLVPVICNFSIGKFFIIMWIHITEKVPRRTCIAGHGVGFTFEDCTPLL